MADNDELTVLSGGAFYDERAKRISDMIDEELREESIKRKEARKREVRVMLLGQAESGKSTLRKQFQLHYASPTLDEERPSWRPIVYFNIIKAVRMILSGLEYEFSSQSKEEPIAVADGSTSGNLDPSETSLEVQNEIGELRVQLLPLVAIEDALVSELSGGVSISGGRTEPYVRSGWQALVTPSWPVSDNQPSREERGPEVIILTAKALASTSAAIQTLWNHRVVKRLLQLRKLRVEESASFFLENLERIAEPDYIPTNTDILNVRLRTLGVTEYTIPINMGGLTYDWKLYDVGGARGQRLAWVPYFDDATAIIFLAPISAFDQCLDEDRNINRLEDSFQLFTAICSNQLLKNAHLVLMLNKADLLKKKLAAGTRVRKYVTSYGDRPDTYENVSEYFRSHFVRAHRRKDTSKRSLYVHFTSMLDIKETQSVISNGKWHLGTTYHIIRQHIAQTDLA